MVNTQIHTESKKSPKPTVNKEGKECKTIEEVLDYISYWQEHKEELPYPIDGIVIKVNEQ